MRDEWERERLRRTYRAYDSDPLYARMWDPRHDEAAAYYHARFEEAVHAVLAPLPSDGSRQRILDVGCGTGRALRILRGLGVPPGRLVGTDLMGDRLRAAREADATIGWVEADAASLPFPDGGFDWVAQVTVLSSVLDDAVRRRIAAQMRRVLTPGGSVFWFDLAHPVTGDGRVRGIPRTEIADLFPGGRVAVRPVYLRRRWVHRLRRLPWLRRPLERIDPLCDCLVGRVTWPADPTSSTVRTSWLAPRGKA